MRVDDLVTERVEGELLVYSRRTGETHALNETAAIVFELCDGATARPAIAEEVARRSGLPPDEDIVELAFADLEEAGLVAAAGPEHRTVSRRALIRRLGLTVIASALLPVVETIVMPPATAAAPVPTCGPSFPVVVE
jgi:PqqD family protein of HPr-rel-A system